MENILKIFLKNLLKVITFLILQNIFNSFEQLVVNLLRFQKVYTLNCHKNYYMYF